MRMLGVDTMRARAACVRRRRRRRRAAAAAAAAACMRYALRIASHGMCGWCVHVCMPAARRDGDAAAARACAAVRARVACIAYRSSSYRMHASHGRLHDALLCRRRRAAAAAADSMLQLIIQPYATV
jgi:hypothetical protein